MLHAREFADWIELTKGGKICIFNPDGIFGSHNATSRARVTRRLAQGVIAAVVAQLLAGIVNLVLLAPGIQLVHLLVADLLWIVLVAL
jgi:hypothetical protein